MLAKLLLNCSANSSPCSLPQRVELVEAHDHDAHRSVGTRDVRQRLLRLLLR